VREGEGRRLRRKEGHGTPGEGEGAYSLIGVGRREKNGGSLIYFRKKDVGREIKLCTGNQEHRSKKKKKKGL